MEIYLGFRLAYLYLTLASYKGQGKGHAHFDDVHISTINILEMVTCSVKKSITSNSKSCLVFRLAYLHCTFTHSKGRSQGHEQIASKW